jgi:hypothetical protein
MAGQVCCTCCAAILVMLLCGGTISARPVSFDYESVENELRTPGENHVAFAQVSDTPIVYRAWGVRNFAHPASEIAAVALDFASYPRVFRYVYRCERIIEPKNRIRPLGTFYVEGRAAVARVWSIGNIDTLCWKDSSHFRFFASQNEDRLLESRFGRQEKGWLNYRTFGVRFAAFVTGSGLKNDSCRVGIVVQGIVNSPMPQWLVRLGMSIILPQLLADLETEVRRRADLKAPGNATWYDRWYRNVKRFFLSDIFGPHPAR